MKKIYKIVIIIMAVIALIAGGFYGYKRYQRYKSYKEDAVFLLDFLEDNYPYFEVKEKVLGYKFLDHKEEFIRKVARSKDDADFYKNVDEVMISLQNGHSFIVNDSYFLSKIKDKNVQEKNHYWWDIRDKSTYLPDIKLKYIEGKYIVIKSMNKDIPIGSIVTKFNGEEIHDYVESKKGTFIFFNDFKRDICYSHWDEYRKFNNYPDDVEIIDSGKVKKARVKYNKVNEKIIKWYYLSPGSTEQNVTTDIINNGKVAYLRIKSFREYGRDQKIIREFFKKCTNVKDIIVDIRGNGGGDSSYANLLISCLADEKLDFKYYNCFRKTEFMKNALSQYKFITMDKKNAPKNDYNLDDFEMSLENKDEKFFSYEMWDKKYVDTNFKGRVHVLVDGSVFSSSEYFADMAKKLKHTQIIGTTTGGDGTGEEAVVTYLPKSKLAIKIAPLLTISEDGTVNEEIHTKPDIYIEQDLEDYKKFLKSGLQDITRSEYDTVYRKTLEMIKKITLE